MLKSLQIVFFAALLALNGFGQTASHTERQTIVLRKGWKFAKGDFPEAPSRAFDDSAWQSVRLPHDWAIAGPFDPQASGETGKLPWKGEGWYRYAFAPDPSWRDKRIFLLFDGVMAFPEIWVNGRRAGKWDYGYNSFYIDITEFLDFQSPNNLVAVHADTRRHESRWYPGAGIYRKVSLIVTGAVHVDVWGAQIATPEITPDAAKVNIRTTVRNAGPLEHPVTLENVILDASGRALAADTAACPLKAGENHVFDQQLTLPRPVLWDIDHPALYTMKTTVKSAGRVSDVYFTTFGVRTMHFTADDGFWLNGRRVQLKGVNLHHDFGALGAAFNVRAAERQLEIMRAMGCNAIRTSHNAPAPELLDLCDRMGFLVVDEIFDKWDARADLLPGIEFEAFAARQVGNFLRRDRNHPCIFLWSAGNEIGDVQGNVNGGFARLETMIAQFRRFDPTRPVTLVCDNRDAAALRHMDYYDVVSFNYGRRYALARQLAPHKAVIITESASTVSTRGFYELPLPAKKTDFTDALQVSSYDLNAPWWAEVPEDDFAWQEADRFVAGEFVWTGFDYLGEPTPYGDNVVQEGRFKAEVTPRSSYFGIVDLAGMLKDRYFLYKSYWNSTETTVHLLPHWNWPGQEGKNIPVFVYTNGDCAELFLNGRSLGRRCKQPGAANTAERYRLMWPDVPYAPGTLRAAAYQNGQFLGETSVKTAGSPAQIRLTPDRTTLRADGDDLAFVLVEVLDRDGNLCPLADNLIQFSLSGPGEIAGLDNGDPLSLASFQAKQGKAFFGKTMLIVRTKEGLKGTIELTAAGKGLKQTGALIKAD